MAAAGLFFVILGAGQWINGHDWGKYSLAVGLVWWLFTLYQWFGDAVRESEGGLYGHKIDLSYRWSMSWFIFSEVMFFGAFFSPPCGGRARTRCPRWAAWTTRCCGLISRPSGPAWLPVSRHRHAGIIEPFQTVGPFWLPTINTALLLTSGVTLTIAHHALRENQRARPSASWATVLLALLCSCWCRVTSTTTSTPT